MWIPVQKKIINEDFLFVCSFVEYRFIFLSWQDLKIFPIIRMIMEGMVFEFNEHIIMTNTIKFD